MKRFYMKFRILLLTLALGMASVPFFKMLYERWTEVRVDVPQIESNAPLIVDVNKQLDDATLDGKRDLSLYEYGGYVVPCDDDKSKLSRECRDEKSRIRQFFLNHWKAKKLSYVTVMDNQSIFIEPDKNGEWHIVRRTIKDFSSDNVNTIWVTEEEFKSMELENGTRGKLYLWFCDWEGKCFGGF
jgi:hypothetical protein